MFRAPTRAVGARHLPRLHLSPYQGFPTQQLFDEEHTYETNQTEPDFQTISEHLSAEMEETTKRSTSRSDQGD